MRKSVVALVVGVVLGGVVPAQASTVIESENPRYQRWVDAAKVPTPDVSVRVVEGQCPDNSSVGCAYLAEREVWLTQGRTRREVRATFLHELGHIYEYETTGGSSESFAEAYRICAWRRLPHESLPMGPRRLRGFCYALRHEEPGRTTVDAG